MFAQNHCENGSINLGLLRNLSLEINATPKVMLSLHMEWYENEGVSKGTHGGESNGLGATWS